MKGFITNIEKDSINNKNFRKVLYTDNKVQLVIMSLKPHEDIGEEVHDVDQFIRIEQGTGKAIVNDVEHEIADGSVVIVPTMIKHNIINTGSEEMKLYTLYTPPHHKDGKVHETKAAAEADEDDEFDGEITEE